MNFYFINLIVINLFSESFPDFYTVIVYKFLPLFIAEAEPEMYYTEDIIFSVKSCFHGQPTISST